MFPDDALHLNGEIDKFTREQKAATESVKTTVGNCSAAQALYRVLKKDEERNKLIASARTGIQEESMAINEKLRVALGA